MSVESRATVERPGKASTRIKRASIWAQTEDGVIGDGKAMLWHVPADFHHFKEKTWGCPLIMGRASYEALGTPLRGRLNIVLTRNQGYNPVNTGQTAKSDDHGGLAVVHSLADAFTLAEEEAARTGAPTIWIAGGAQVYKQAMSQVDELVVSYLDLEVAAPKHAAVAPNIDPAEWHVINEESDSEWRPQSGDARWLVKVYRRWTESPAEAFQNSENPVPGNRWPGTKGPSQNVNGARIEQV